MIKRAEDQGRETEERTSFRASGVKVRCTNRRNAARKLSRDMQREGESNSRPLRLLFLVIKNGNDRIDERQVCYMSQRENKKEEKS